MVLPEPEAEARPSVAGQVEEVQLASAVEVVGTVQVPAGNLGREGTILEGRYKGWGTLGPVGSPGVRIAGRMDHSIRGMVAAGEGIPGVPDEEAGIGSAEVALEVVVRGVEREERLAGDPDATGTESQTWSVKVRETRKVINNQIEDDRCQKEGNGNIHTDLRIRIRSVIYIRNGSSGGRRLVDSFQSSTSAGQKVSSTYPKDSRVIRDLWWLRLLILLLFIRKADILDVASTEHDILVNARRRRNFFGRIPTSAFRAMRYHVFECNGRSLRVDLVQGPNIATH